MVSYTCLNISSPHAPQQTTDLSGEASLPLKIFPCLLGAHARPLQDKLSLLSSCPQEDDQPHLISLQNNTTLPFSHTSMDPGFCLQPLPPWQAPHKALGPLTATPEPVYSCQWAAGHLLVAAGSNPHRPAFTMWRALPDWASPPFIPEVH